MIKRTSVGLVILIFLAILVLGVYGFFTRPVTYNKNNPVIISTPVPVNPTPPAVSTIPPLNIALYDQKLISLANNPPDPIVYTTIKTITKNSKGKSITTITKVLASPQPVAIHL